MVGLRINVLDHADGLSDPGREILRGKQGARHHGPVGCGDEATRSSVSQGSYIEGQVERLVRWSSKCTYRKGANESVISHALGHRPLPATRLTALQGCDRCW